MTLVVERLGDVTRWHMSSGPGRAVGVTVSAYVYRGVLIDSGFHAARAALEAALATERLRGAVITHWHEDHAGNAALLASRGVPILLRPDTEEVLRARPLIQLYRRLIWGRPPALEADIARFDPDDLECIHSPGHSEDHQVVWFPDTRTLFSGDLWLGVRSRVLHVDEDPYQIVESLRRIAALEPERMFDAHRGLVAKPAESLMARADWLSRKLDKVEGQIAAGRGDRAIVTKLFGGEEMASVVSFGEYSRRNLVRAVRRRLSSRA